MKRKASMTLSVRKILKQIPYARSFYLHIKRILYSNNPIFYEHRFDNIACNANFSFLENDLFIECYQRAVKNAGRDYRFYLRVHQALWCAEMTAGLEGDFIELGTGRGYIFGAVTEYLRKVCVEKKIYMFDTFLPYKTDILTGEQLSTAVRSDYYADSYESVAESFKYYQYCTLVKGRCPQIIEEYVEGNTIKKVAFLHVDLNYDKVEIASLEILWPIVTEGGIVLLDDYANMGRQSQNSALNHFFEKRRLPILTTATGQGIVVKKTL